MDRRPRTVVELKEFAAFAERHLTDEERTDIVTYVALDPFAGDLMPGTGGLRKLRWAAKGKGKSGGVRVIHYFGGENLPVFLVTGFAKSGMGNIGKAARNTYRRLLPLIVRAYKERRP